jgi:hypothetical protein
MKKIIISLVLVLSTCIQVYAQSYNANNINLANFVQRMYNNAPFQGVRLLEDYDNKYLLSVIVLDPAKYGNNESTMNRVASVKAMSEASRFFNGSKITSDLIITTREDSSYSATTEILEKINEQSIGYISSLSQLINFLDANNKRVFVYYKQLVQIDVDYK